MLRKSSGMFPRTLLITLSTASIVALSACGSSPAQEGQRTQAAAEAKATTAQTVEAPAPTTESDESQDGEGAEDTTSKVGPKKQQDFVAAIEKGSADYDSAPNELKQEKALKTRDKKLCSVTDGTFEKWEGTVKSLGTNGDGDAYLVVSIGGDSEIGTWNNAFSDAGDQTLIPANSKLWDAVSDLSEDDTVTVSGKFIADRPSCVKTGNMSKTFNASSPDFKVKFTSVKGK